MMVAARIAVVNWTRRHAGGIETYIEDLVSELARAGRAVAFWHEGDDPADRALLIFPSSVPQWSAVSGTEEAVEALEAWKPSVLVVNGLQSPEVEARLLRVAPAALVAHTYYGTCISGSKTHTFPAPQPCARTFGPACLGLFYPRRCGGLSPVTLLKDYSRQHRRLELARRYSLVLTLSEHMRQEYVRHRLDPASVRALPPYFSSRDEVRADPGYRPRPNADMTLLYMGRLDMLKGCGLFIDALRHVKARHPTRSILALIAGDGPDRNRCERLARDAGDGIAVEFAGWIGRDVRDRMLAQADVLVLPSLWPEPYGLSGVEAVAAGVPVAAFRSGGVPEWLVQGRGHLAPSDPPTSDGLAQAIVSCLALGRQPPSTRAQLLNARSSHFSTLLDALDGIAVRGATVGA